MISKCSIEQLGCLSKYLNIFAEKSDFKNLVHNEDCIKKTQKITCQKKIFVTHIANNGIIGIYKKKKNTSTKQ